MVKIKNKTVSVSQTAVNPLSLQQVPKQGLADTEKVQQFGKWPGISTD